MVTQEVIRSSQPKPLDLPLELFHSFSKYTGSLRTEPGTGNRTFLEPEPAEPDTELELAEPELEKMKILENPQKSKKSKKTTFRSVNNF